MNPLHITLAILPALFICYGIYRIDQFDKESHWHLVICFMLGMLVTVPAMHLEALGEAQGFEQGNTHLGKLLVLSFLIVGLTEELAKFLPLLLFGYTRKAFNEPLDGIVYSVMIAMGFATLENVMYADRFGLGTTVIRAFTAVPAHAVFGVFMGYYVGLAKFDQQKRNSYLIIGLLLATVVHGLYDFFILQEYYDWLMLFATLTLAVSLFFALRLIRQHQENSPFRTDDEPDIRPDAEMAEAEEIVETEDPASALPEVDVPDNVEEYNEISDAVIREMKGKNDKE